MCVLEEGKNSQGGCFIGLNLERDVNTLWMSELLIQDPLPEPVKEFFHQLKNICSRKHAIGLNVYSLIYHTQNYTEGDNFTVI